MECAKCHEEFPTRIVIDGKVRNLSSRRYCVSCSPFGANNRKKIHIHDIRRKPTRCRLCSGKLVPGKGDVCYTCRSRIRRYRVKVAAITLLGGKCQRCGFSGSPAAFEFHHNGKKDFQISENSNRAWAVVKKEVLKCELLCSNCHRQEHTGDRGEAFLRAVAEYRGMPLT